MTTWTVVSPAGSAWRKALGYLLVGYVEDHYVHGNEQSPLTWIGSGTADSTWTEA